VSGGYQQEECFGPEASRFLKALLNVGGELWIEQDVEDRDQYGRLLRWVWADFGTGEVYLLNEALLRAGFAERYRNTPNDLYLDELLEAETFAQDYQLGLWKACDMPNRVTSASVPTTMPRATLAPTSVAAFPAPSSTDDRPGCDPSYPEVCIPPYPPDLSCGDVPYDHLRVLPPDPHHFDGNGDGVGCEGPPA
jgi:micrococcal nuclease